MNREILSELPTLLKHKFKREIANFAALNSPYIFKTIQNHHHISFYTFAYISLSVINYYSTQNAESENCLELSSCFSF